MSDAVGATAAEIEAALEGVAQFGIPVAGTARLFDVGSGDYLRYFEDEVLDDLVAQGGATCRFIEGVYGSGKTHLLDLLRDLALSRGMVVARTDLSQAQGLDDWRLIVRYLLQKMEARIEAQTVRSLPRILAALARCGRPDLHELDRAHLPHTGFQHAMLTMAAGCHGLEPAGQELLQRYLLGDTVPAGVLRRAGASGIKNPLSQKNAEQVLGTVAGGLFKLGIPGTLLAFDENERSLAYLGTAPSRRVIGAANRIRRLVDHCASGGLSGAVAVFAILPTFLDQCSRAYPALGQRLEMVRDAEAPAAWRWPVLPISAIATTRSPEQFLAAVVTRFEALVAACGKAPPDLRARMLPAGQRILAQNAGSGYRRELMKGLGLIAYQYLQ